MNILLNKLPKTRLLKPLFSNANKKSIWKTASLPKSLPSKTWLAFLLGISTVHELKRYSRQAFCAEEAKAEEKKGGEEEVSREEKVSMLKQISTYEIGVPSDFVEGGIHEITVNHEGKDLKVIITRVKGQLHATSAFCTYDDKTPLKEGVVFGNKIYAPIWGSAYNVTTGSVEYGPAVDNLAIFFIREKEGKVYLGVPKYPPKKVRPVATFRDYNDLRKVVVIGTGIAALTCIETLRQNGYSGEIKVISKDTVMPYDKTKLSKSFKNINYDDLIIRSEDYLDEQGIELLLGREVKQVHNKHGSPHVELEDGLRIEYDALLVATGAKPAHRDIEGFQGQSNVSYLKDIYDHKNIREQLEKAKNVVIVGANFLSLETAATIRTEYPKINVHVIDENETLFLDDKLGREVADTLIDLHKKNGVKFTFAKGIEKFLGDEKRVKQIQLEENIKVNTDLVLLFPNTCEGNTEMLFETETLENLEFDEEARVKVDFNQRTEHKRVFGAGDATAGMYFLHAKRMASDSYYMAYHGGVTAAYNIMALDIPTAVVPFTYTKQYNTYFNYSGYASYYNDVYIDGDLKSLDFIAYYSVMGEILAAFGSEKRKRDMLVINEAFRLDLMPTVEELQSGEETIASLERKIRASKRSGCFRDLINELQYSPKPDQVLWMQREKSNEYHNFWQEGHQPMGANVVADED